MTKQGVTDALSNFQSMLQPTAQTRETMRDTVSGLWSNQDKILDSMEQFTNGWFERRHAGTRAALAAAQRICDMKTPIDMMREYQTWAMGSLGRIVADSFAFQHHLITMAGLFAKPLSASEEECVIEAEEGAAEPMVIKSLAASVLTQHPDETSPKQ